MDYYKTSSEWSIQAQDVDNQTCHMKAPKIKTPIPINPKNRDAYDSVAEDYSEVFSDIRVRAVEFAWIVARLGLSEPIIIDAGCGNGSLLAALAPRISQGIGLDVSVKMIQQAGIRIAGLQNLELRRITDSRWPIDDRSADLVISCLSFRYMDWPIAWTEIRRILKPGGRWLMVDMVADGLRWFEIPVWIGQKIMTLWRQTRNRRFSQALHRLVDSPQWQNLVRQNPPRPLAEYRRFFGQVTPTAAPQTLNIGRRAKIIALDSGPLPGFPWPKLAILDWGIGGTAFYRLCKQAFPETAACYFSDTGFRAYGRNSASVLVNRLQEIINVLASQGVTQLVIACNAMSTVLNHPRLRLPAGWQLTGVIQPTIEVILQAPPASLGIIGGMRTIRSQAYARALRPLVGRWQAGVAQPLSGMIEQGRMGDPVFARTLKPILKPFRGIAGLIMACTHYPAAQSQIQEQLPGTRLYDPAQLTLDWISRNWAMDPQPGPDLFLTTGDPQSMIKAAELAFGVKIQSVSRLLPNLRLATGPHHE